MSTLIVPVTEITDVKSHPNADRLELAIIGGWQVVVGKGSYQPGDHVVYVPPDAVIPVEWSDKWEVTKYLSNGRVRCAKLRGEPSFGFTVSPSHLPSGDYVVGDNVAEVFGITKYDPPIVYRGADSMSQHPLFVKYTEIENMRSFPSVIADGEEVVATEKIHGTNCRIGLIEGERMAGSMNVRLKQPEDPKASWYWMPFTLPGVGDMLEALGRLHRQVILFGETYGRVQKLRYGLENGIAFRAFDLLCDGKYVGWDAFEEICRAYGVETVPLLYRGPFSLDQAKALSEGKTMLGGGHIREGVVIKPIQERVDPTVGRVMLKFVSDAYLLSGKDEPVEVVA